MAGTTPDVVQLFSAHPGTMLFVLFVLWYVANPLIGTTIFYVLVRAAVRKFSKSGKRRREVGVFDWLVGVGGIAWEMLESAWASACFIVFLSDARLHALFARVFSDEATRDAYVAAREMLERKKGTPFVSPEDDVVGDLSEMYRDVVTFGPTMGIIERTLVFVLAIYGQYEAIAVTFAFKGLIAQLIGGNGGFPSILPALPLRFTATARNVRQPPEDAGTTRFELDVAAPQDANRQLVQANHGPLDMFFFEKESYLLGSLLSFLIGTLGGMYAATLDVPSRRPEPAKVEKVSGASPDAAASEPASPRRVTMSQRNRVKVLLDMDTGVDDALAVMLALHSPELDVVGISTVSGNVTAEQARLNTEYLLEQFDVDVDWKVRGGESHALSGRRPQSVPEIHGKDGLGGIRSPSGDDESRLQSTEHAGISPGVQLIVNQARANRGRLRIVATGPLTNIARAIRHDREAMEQIEGLFVMGGALDRKGNITPHAEFNVHCDPEAFDVVLKSHVPVTLFPLNVTESVRLDYPALDESLRLPAAELRLLRDLTRIYSGFHLQTEKFDGCYMHDVHPIASLLEPGLFEFRREGVVVETEDPERRGRLAWTRLTSGAKSTRVAVRVDAGRFLDFYWKRLRRDEPKCVYRTNLSTANGPTAD